MSVPRRQSHPHDAGRRRDARSPSRQPSLPRLVRGRAVPNAAPHDRAEAQRCEPVPGGRDEPRGGRGQDDDGHQPRRCTGPESRLPGPSRRRRPAPAPIAERLRMPRREPASSRRYSIRLARPWTSSCMDRRYNLTVLPAGPHHAPYEVLKSPSLGEFLTHCARSSTTSSSTWRRSCRARTRACSSRGSTASFSS